MTLFGRMTRAIAASFLAVALAGLAAACASASSAPTTTPSPTAVPAQQAAATATSPATNPYLVMAAALAQTQYPANLEDGMSLGSKSAKVVIQAI